MIEFNDLHAAFERAFGENEGLQLHRVDVKKSFRSSFMVNSPSKKKNQN